MLWVFVLMVVLDCFMSSLIGCRFEGIRILYDFFLFFVDFIIVNFLIIGVFWYFFCVVDCIKCCSDVFWIDCDWCFWINLDFLLKDVLKNVNILLLFDMFLNLLLWRCWLEVVFIIRGFCCGIVFDDNCGILMRGIIWCFIMVFDFGIRCSGSW